MKFIFGSEDDTLTAPNKKEETELAEYTHVPDITALADRLRSCLQESEDLPKDFTSMFSSELFKFDTNLVPDGIELYE